jgi:hypothetical protein
MPGTCKYAGCTILPHASAWISYANNANHFDSQWLALTLLQQLQAELIMSRAQFLANYSRVFVYRIL